MGGKWQKNSPSARGEGRENVHPVRQNADAPAATLAHFVYETAPYFSSAKYLMVRTIWLV